MVWFGSLGFNRDTLLTNNPFLQGMLGIQTTGPNSHHLNTTVVDMSTESQDEYPPVI